MTQPNHLTLDDLDPVLKQVLGDHSDKTLAWMRTEPGAWGYLAGQAVAATRRHLDDASSLTQSAAWSGAASGGGSSNSSSAWPTPDSPTRLHPWFTLRTLPLTAISRRVPFTAYPFGYYTI